MSISISGNIPPSIASQDAADGADANRTAKINSAIQDEVGSAAVSQTDLVSAHAGLVALAKGVSSGGVNGLVNPDLDGEGARLQALQLQQQLGAQTNSIANQAPQALLALLR